ncbi:hypothetical protein BY996DRAFT_6460216 [Phakopsora pachyrhizi]|nr:hypothetical protein BY996DRAFT_6460216 [Phakopsora pachyrhizi]
MPISMSLAMVVLEDYKPVTELLSSSVGGVQHYSDGLPLHLLRQRQLLSKRFLMSEAAVTTLAILGESGVGVLSSLEARSIVADEKCEKKEKEEEEEIAVDFEDD